MNASTLLDRVLEAGRGDHPALITADGTVTYGELARLISSVAAQLRELGVQREQRVLMILDDSPFFHAVFLGAMRIGAVPVPVSPMDRVDNFAYFLDDSYAKVMFVEDALMPALEPVLVERGSVQVLVRSSLIAEGDLLPPVDTHADDMAFWLYSSGSTGRPKGVVHRHADILVTADTYARQVLGIGPDDVCFSTTKLFHAYGLGNALSFPMSVGATSVLMEGRPAPDRVFSMVERRRPTLFFSVPALYAAMVKSVGAASADFSSVRACVSAAEPLPAPVLERWIELMGVPILDGIGSTEMLHIYCSNTLDDLAPGTSGRPVPGYSVRVVDDAGAPVAPGDAGDLLVRGDSCAAFYWHQSEKTRQSMRGEWFVTGDRYLVDADGHYVYQGRSDDMIKVGGLWVSPADVEACLVGHQAVSEAAVIGVQVEDVSRIKAFVICTSPPPDPPALADDLRAWCKASLRRYEYPHVVEFVDDFPRTLTGKVQRFKLREEEAEAEAARAAGAARAAETPSDAAAPSAPAPAAT